MGNVITEMNVKRQPAGPAESGTQCGTAGTGNDIDDDSDGTKDDGCPSTKYAYDSLDRMTSTTDALARVTSYQYDAASNLTQRTDGRGLVTKYFPDSLRRLDLIEYWTGGVLTSSVDYTYNAVGFRTQMVDPSGTTTYTPDALDRLSSATFPGPKTVSYTYDDLPGGSAADYPGQRTVMTYPDSKTATYTYLANGALGTVTDWLSKQTAYTYNDAGMPTKTQLPNTAWTDYGYDTADRLTSVVNKKTGPVTLSSFTYTLDANGNRTQLVDLAGTHSYQFDQLYRLTQVTYPGPQTDTYTYDGVGNRLTMNAVSYTYDAADQMLTAGAVSYGYDNNGNQTTRGSDTFTYDHENRLTQTVISGATSSSVYNGDGLRMGHTVSGTPTNYTWDVNAGLPVVLQDGTNTYVYGLDLISSTDGSGNQTYYTTDGLGSTTDITDGNAVVTGTYSYDVFGAVRSQTGGGSNYWQFTGEQTDADSGLYYLRARYYDPASGRFLSKDPLPIGNLYSYSLNNPVNYSDPSGMSPCGVAVTGAVVVSTTTGAASGGTTIVVSSAGAATICVGTVVVAYCYLRDSGCADTINGAITGAWSGAEAGADAIVGGAGAAIGAAGDAIGSVGGLFSRGGGQRTYVEPRFQEDPGLRGIGHEFRPPTSQNFPWRGCGSYSGWRRGVCWSFVAGGLGGAAGSGFTILTGEKPPTP